MKTKKFNSRTSRRRAQAAIELALVLPVLMLLALLVVQYSILMNTAASITNLSREGARYAVSSGASSNDSIADRIRTVDDNYGLDIAVNDITVTPADAANRTVGTSVTVSITYDMRKKLFLPPTLFGMTLFNQNYVGQTTMMMQPK
jgi:Flp pilus assembly protein TadG